MVWLERFRVAVRRVYNNSPDRFERFGQWYNDHLPWSVVLLPLLWFGPLLYLAGFGGALLLLGLAPLMGVTTGIGYVVTGQLADLQLCAASFAYTVIVGALFYWFSRPARDEGRDR